jgi:hypothetical protein
MVVLPTNVVMGESREVGEVDITTDAGAVAA